MRTLALCAATILTAAPAAAETLRWARAGDGLTLDPHAQNEGGTHTLNHQIYEPLVLRDTDGELVPALATEWEVSEDDPTVWRFTLREGVTFHDGAAFTAEDVVFSFERALSDNSAMKELLGSITEIRAVDEHMVEFVTDGPNPILPSNFTNLFVMDSGWAEENDAVEVQDFAGGETTHAAMNANGTGAYVVESREPDTRTVLTQFDGYWGQGEFPLDVTRIDFTPIQNPATRIAALLSGEVDFIQDVPVQDLSRVEGAGGLVVRTAPQNRSIFFGMEQGKDDLETDSIEGANPFADVRVRRAMNMAVDRQAIQRIVMRGQSDPAGMIAPPFVNGWSEALDALPEGSLEEAQALMEEAGYGDGFRVQMDCPNDRYVNDEAICQAVVGMMGRIGITVALNAVPKAQFFPLVTGDDTEFYLVGWGVPTFDSEYVFNFLVHSRTGDRGSWNATGYGNAEVDGMIESLSSEIDEGARDATIEAIWERMAEDVVYLPLHNQVLNWGMRESVEAEVDPEDQPKFKRFSLQ